VGHKIEYFASLAPSAVRAWLDGLDGFYYSDPGDPIADWEGRLASGGAFWAHMAASACNFSLAMNYSLLLGEWPPAVDSARRFEAEFWSRFEAVPLLRVDEYLVGEWLRSAGREWWESPDPIEELLAWLGCHESHWAWLTPEPGAA
jgi:hypothetical protein